MDTHRVAKYAQLRRIAKAKTAEAKAANEEADAMQQELIEEFFAEGTQKITTGGSTVYLATDIYATKLPGVDTEEFHTALSAADLADFVRPTVSAQTLSAWARELVDNERPIPPELDGVLKISYVTRLKTTAAVATKTRTPN